MDKYKEEDSSSVECAECIKSALVSSPRLVVWSALEASKHKLTRNLKQKSSAELNKKKGYLKNTILGLIFTLLAISTLIWKPYDVFMSERLEMRRGFPAFEWWADPPEEVFLSVYIFNITNPNEFTRGLDRKMKLQEIGPIVYMEKLTHTDIELNDNSTLTYTATRRAVLLPERNTIDLDAIVYVPNLAVLGISSYLWNVPYAIKLGFSLLVGQKGSKPLVPVRIKDYLWNLTDPVSGAARTLAPHLIPTENFGVLQQIYDRNGEYSDRLSVLMGEKNGPNKFFHVDTYNGSPGFGAWRNATCDSVQGSSEGVGYHQEIKRTDVLWYLRKSFCRIAPLYYTGDHVMSGMQIYKFELSNATFDRPADGNECYLSDGLPPLPSGQTDASPCFHNFPIATSFPHFMNSDPVVYDKIEGLKPDYDKHHSYIYVEPNTGVPLTASAKIQCNLVMRPMKSGFSKLRPFYNMSIPMFWAEYKQVGIPWKITALTYFVVIIAHNYQTYFSIFLLMISSLCFYKSYRRATSSRNKKRNSHQATYTSIPAIINDDKLSS